MTKQTTETKKIRPIHRKKIKQSVKIIPEEEQILELVDKTILNIFRELKESISKELKESM